MSYIFPFANVIFLTLGLVREISKIQILQLPLFYISLLGFKIGYHYRRTLDRFGIWKWESIIPIRINGLFCITPEQCVIRGQVESDSHNKSTWGIQGSPDNIQKVIIFYMLRGAQYACMISPRWGEDVQEIPDLFIEKAEELDLPQLLSCQIGENITSEFDVTENVVQYMGPLKNFHGHMPQANFDPTMMLDLKGNFIFDVVRPLTQGETTCNYPDINIVMLTDGYKISEKHINLLDLEFEKLIKGIQTL